MKNIVCSLVVGFTCLVLAPWPMQAAEWSVPTGGNAFHTAPEPSREGFRRSGAIAWSSPESVFSVYFHVNHQADLLLKIDARGTDGRSVLQARIGEESFEVAVDSLEQRVHEVGQVQVPAGYVRVDLQGIERTGKTFAEIHNLIVVSDTQDLQLDYVTSNKGNMFYWGRRGPSVHLRYEVPQDRQIQYAYSEVTVPVGQDPVGSYFMANGFAEGYFGIQVNGPDERRVLFSVWSPFKTDNPRDIPQDQQIVALDRGRDVHIGEFGNEGSGGQSYLVYPWKAGSTYRFLTEVSPDGKGGTVYASWFADKSANEWRLIARFRRPKTDTHLRSFHSFLESFSPVRGYLGRQARYGNMWVCDVTGQWHECTRARFSVDATGGGRQRLDFSGGSDGGNFFLRNCGFFSETGHPGEVFTRESTAEQRPTIDFGTLPQVARADGPTTEIVPLTQAHAHNDYLHERPLLDALDQGFCSVEADIFLVEGELLVGHTRSEVSRQRTLKKLYLDPLSERVKSNGGRVYPGGPVVTLLIDFKHDGAATYEALDTLLGQYPDVFSVVNDGQWIEKAVNVVISGDRPFESVVSDSERFAGLDGRLTDLDSDRPVHLMPMISDRWGGHFKWRGEGEMSAEEKEKLATIVKQVHASGRVLRFWAIPDNPVSWKTMQKAGVDLINTDNLAGLSRLLRE